MPKKTVHEFDEATDYSGLPEHVKKAFGGRIEVPEDYESMPDMASSDYGPRHMHEEHDEEEMPYESHGENMPEHYAHGGIVPEDNYDYQMGNATSYDSTGEPHTEFEHEDEHPMEYMHKDGMMKKMARGGMMRSPDFVKALRKARY